MKKFLLKPALLLCTLIVGVGTAWGTTKTEGFEAATAATSYQSTKTITTSQSDCGIAWSIYYGSPSATNKISGSNSCLMRYYTADKKLGYAMTTTPIYGLSNVTFNAKVTKSDVKLGVWYSTDGSEWTGLATNVALTTTNYTFSQSHDIPSPSSSIGYYIKIGMYAAGTDKEDLIIDDVVFTSIAPTVSVSPTNLDFGTVLQDAIIAAKTISLTGSDLTGAISISVPSGYSVSPSSITPSNGTIAATNITITPNTSSVGTFNGNLTITDGGLPATVTVPLTMEVVTPVAVTGVSFDKANLTLGLGESKTLTPTFSPANATNRNISWSSSNTAVATVSDEGEVTAISEGNSVITATTEDGSFTANCSVAVSYLSSLVFSAACKGSGTANDEAVWTVTSDASESTYDATKGVHYGTGSAAVSYLCLSTSDIPGIINKIIVNASGASSTSAKLNVTVGGNAFGEEKSLTSTATEYALTGSASGEIIVSMTQSSQTKAIYCKSIVVITDMSGSLNAKSEAPYGFATFCGSYNFTINPEDGKVVKAYKAALDDEAIVLSELSGIIPKDEGVILAGTPGASYTINYTTADATAIMTGNKLHGKNTAKDASSLYDSETQYLLVFNKNSNNFVKYTGTVPAHKAYLLYNFSGSSLDAPTLRLDFDEENNATNLKNLDSTDNAVHSGANRALGKKFIENGQLLILRDGITYDLLGRIVK